MSSEISRRPAWLRRRQQPAVDPADRWQRAVGWLIDVVPFLLVGGGLVYWSQGPNFVLGELRSLLGLPVGAAAPAGNAPVQQPAFGDLLLLVVALGALTALWVAYRVVATAKYGQTLGKWLVGSRVVRVSDPTKLPTLKQSWKRFLVPQTSGLLPVPGTGLIPYLSLCLHPRRRGLHDKVAGTIVVKTDGPHLPHPLQSDDAGERQSVGENS